jgi:hypothetical protein
LNLAAQPLAWVGEALPAALPSSEPGRMKLEP